MYLTPDTTRRKAQAIAEFDFRSAQNRGTAARRRLQRIAEARKTEATGTSSAASVAGDDPNLDPRIVETACWCEDGEHVIRTMDGVRFQRQEVAFVSGVSNPKWNCRVVFIEGPKTSAKPHWPCLRARLLHNKAGGIVDLYKLSKVDGTVFKALHADDRKLLERLGTRQVTVAGGYAADEDDDRLLTVDEALAMEEAGYRVDAQEDGPSVMVRGDKTELQNSPLSDKSVEGQTGLSVGCRGCATSCLPCLTCLRATKRAPTRRRRRVVRPRAGRVNDTVRGRVRTRSLF